MQCEAVMATRGAINVAVQLPLGRIIRPTAGASYVGVPPMTDDEALEAFQLLSRLEGIIPALEPAHAIAKVMELAPKRPKDHLMVVNLSGRGDKDLASVAEYLGKTI